MSVAISACTLCTALWPSGAKATASSGRILQVTLADKTARRFVHASFDPQDETVFYAATDKSEIYAFCMSRNVVKLFAALEYPVTSFDCVSGVGRPLLLCATEDGSLTWMDCTTSRILSRSKTPHRMAIHAIGTMGGCGTSKLAFTLSSDTLTVWDVVRMAPRANSCRSEMHAVGSFIAAHMGEKTIVTVESSGCVTAWEVPTLLQVRSVVAVSVRLRASSVCQKYVAVGGSNALVGLIRTDDFTSMGALTLSKDHAAVRSLTFVHDEMLVCELTNGIVVFVVLETFTIAFAMEVPFTLTLPKKLSIFALSGPSFAVFAHGDKLTVFHLPTARQCYLQLRRIDIAKNNPASPTVAHSFVQKVGDGRGGAKGATQKRDGEVVGGKKDDEGAERRQFTLRPNATQVAKWVKVNLVTKQRGISGDTADTYPEVAEQGSLCPESQKRSNNAARSQNDDNNGGEEIHLRKFLDEASLSANMKCLKRLLLRYGTFPDKYRPVTWRFLSKLPEKRFTAPQYAQLLSKGTHPSASSLIKPFPLDNKQTQESMEKVLSILAWHLPMFAVIHFLPLIVYPFLRVLKNDLQTTVELVLVFLSNWGQEFFQFYPHHPVALTTLLDELLRREDEQLHGYLERCGIMVETWGWLPLRSVYTDILTQAEWMQVMDHALFNEPLWLFLFHVRWMVSVRGEFFKQQGQQELTEFCLSVHDVDVNSVIAEAYRLQERCVRGELTKCYEYLRPFVNHAYPVAWECAEENIATMLKDMQLSLSHELRNRESRQRIKALSETLAEADVLKEVYAKGKQARVAAELSVKTEKWKGEVARKKEENEVRTMENMMRLQRMKRDVEHRMSLESLSADLISTRAQLAHLDDEGEREILNWKRAENLTNRELVRLESATRDRLAMAIKGIEKDEQCNTQCSATVSGSATNSASNKDTCTHLAAAADEATSFVTPLVEGHRSGLQSGDPLEVYRSLQNSAKQETGRSVASKLDTPPALHNCISGASLHHSAGTGVRQDDAFARAAALPTTNFPVASAASANTNKSRYRDTKNLLYDNLLDTSLTSTEERYAHTVNCARRVESALARSFATVNTLKELPAEALMLAQEGVVYLLVAECVLGHCPPTMHPFLLRAKMSNSSLLSDCMSGTSSNCSASSLQNAAHMYQCQFLCVRWLTAEGLLTDEELLDALCEEDETLRGRQESRFDLHVAMAKRLSIACSFSPRAHVVLTRALLLHHCSTLVSVEDLSLHLRFLNPQNSVELCELESGLLFWMRYVLKAMWRSGQITEELYTTATQELDGSLYQSLKSGLILALVVHFYKPCVLSLARIIDDSETATACGTPQRCHLKRWAVLLRVSEEMSISPNLYADEVTQFGTVVLHLHVLRFVEELFAVLATLAEVTGDFHGCCDEDYEIQTAPGLQRENFSTESVDKLALSSKMECESAHETGSTHHGELNTTSSGGSCGVPVTRSDAQTNTNSTLSIYQSFPSQHSRRQYEVMKTSLRQLSVEVENEPQVSEHSPHQVRSPSRFGKSFEWRHSSTDESFPQGIFVQQDVAKHNARRPGSSWSELRRSHDTFRVTENVKRKVKLAKAPISSWENRRDDVDLVSSSPLVPSLVDSSAYFHASLGDSHHGFHPCYVHRAQTSGSAGVSVVRIAEPSVESTDVLSLERHTAALPARAIASTLSWPTSESSFPMNMVGTPRASLNKDCSTVTTPQEGGRIPEACIPATVSSSSVVKPVVYGSCSHLSSLTHEFTTSSEVTPLDTCSSSSGRDAQPRSIKSMKKSSQAPSSQVDERGFDVQSVLREVASLNPAFLVATGSRRTLLRTLEHQKELLQRLANKFLEAK